MEKKIYERPVAHVELFAPNEYIAACWIVFCNVGTGYGWVDSDNDNRLDDGEYLISPNNNYSEPVNGYYGTYISSGRNATEFTYVGGCNQNHAGVSIGEEGPTANAKWRDESSYWPYPVYFWVDEQGGHATKINSHKWQTNPNAS